ncbi:MAG: major membrane immunogen (membrane-anchored lipoprotein) [Gammaproteobacteria bacterium]|jgi:major membrane immunogen (membrane-anchored lipoprotein)
MKLLKLSLMLVLVSLFAACGDDDSNECTQSDWVGIYTGTAICDGVSEDVTVTITASGTDKIIITYETTNLEAEYDPLDYSGCDINEAQSAGTTSLTVDASIDGDNFSLTEVITIGAATSTCTLTASK